MYSKMVLRILSISLALFVAAMIFPGVVKSVHADSDLDLSNETTDVDLGNVPLNTAMDITFVVANENAAPLGLSLFPPADTDCTIKTSSDSINLLANESEALVVTYETSTTESCSGQVVIFWFGEGNPGDFHYINVGGKGGEAKNSNIVIGAFDTGIPDREWEDRYISEWIDEYAQSARNHGQFVKRMVRLTRKLMRDGVITRGEKKVLRRTARWANIPSIGIEVSERGTIVIGGRDTRIDDRTYDGYLISEWLSECSGDADTHGQFVSCVSQLMKNMKKEGLVTKKDKHVMRKYVAKAKYKGNRCKK